MNKQACGPAYPLYLSNSFFNEDQILRPDGYQRLLIQLSDLHRSKSTFDPPALIERYGASWVLLSLSLQIHRHIFPGEKICAQTWDTWQQGILFRREAALYGQDGTLAFSAAFFHTLMDLDTRRISQDKELYAMLRQPEGPELLAAGSRIPFQPGIGEEVGTRQVMPSWLDYMGHMNNIRYGEVLYDCLDIDQRKKLCRLSRLELYFLRELRLHDRFTLYANDCGDSLEISATCGHISAFGARALFDLPLGRLDPL